MHAYPTHLESVQLLRFLALATGWPEDTLGALFNWVRTMDRMLAEYELAKAWERALVASLGQAGLPCSPWVGGTDRGALALPGAYLRAELDRLTQERD